MGQLRKRGGVWWIRTIRGDRDRKPFDGDRGDICQSVIFVTKWCRRRDSNPHGG
jgi:hypothetical protein